MKRSEMINNIAVFLSEVRLNNHLDQYGDEYVSDKLLAMLETYGMKAPYNDKDLTNYDIAMGSDIHAWEDE